MRKRWRKRGELEALTVTTLGSTTPNVSASSFSFSSSVERWRKPQGWAARHSTSLAFPLSLSCIVWSTVAHLHLLSRVSPRPKRRGPHPTTHAHKKKKTKKKKKTPPPVVQYYEQQERFAKKNEAEDLRRAFEKLDTRGYYYSVLAFTRTMSLNILRRVSQGW